ncbi:MAG: hypothetical protein ABL986_08940 [Vicinamibacterales bacterium]
MVRTLVAVILALALLAPVPARAQTSNATSAPALVGNWQGTLVTGNGRIRIGLVVTATTGGYDAYLVIIEQEESRAPVQQVTLTGNRLHLDITAIRGAYDGIISANGQEIVGTLTQGMAVPLTFARVDKLDAPPTFGEAEQAAVRTVIGRYFSTFTAGDWDGYRSVLQAPFIIWAVGGTPTVVATVDEMVARMRQTRDSLNGTDYAISRVERMIITPLSGSAALVDIHWRRDKKDGTLFGEGAEILTVVRTPAGWKVTGNMGRALSQFGKSF